MDPVQLTIIIISFALAILFVVLGIQVFYILREMKYSLQKVNKMLDDAGKISGTIGSTFSGLGGIINGIKTGLSFFSSFREKKTEEEGK